MSLLLAFHTAVSYLVAGQPLHRALHARLFPRSVDTESRRAALDWMLCSAGTLLLSLAIALAVPFFSALQDLLGAVLGAPLVFGLPAFFFLRASRASGTPPTLTLALALALALPLALTLTQSLSRARHAAAAARPRAVRALPRILHSALRHRRHRLHPRADPRVLDFWHRRRQVAGSTCT